MIRKLLYYGHPTLRKKSVAIQEMNENVKEMAQDLIDTVIENDGAGLAAPQIGYSFRLFVCRYENSTHFKEAPVICPPKIYINSFLSNPSRVMDVQKEGSLSIPGIYEPVIRPWEIYIQAMDLNGRPFSEWVKGWLARNVMHQNDSLNATLFIDRLDARTKKKIKPLLSTIQKKFNA